MVVCGGLWWFAVVCGGLWWFVVDCGGLSFSHTDSNPGRVASEFWQFRLPHIASVFRRRH